MLPRLSQINPITMNPLYTYQGIAYHQGQSVLINYQDGGYWKGHQRGIIQGLNSNGAVVVSLSGAVRVVGKCAVFQAKPLPTHE